MESWRELGKIIDLYTWVSYYGIRSSNGEEMVEGASVLPGKDHYPEGLEIKLDQVHKELSRIDRFLMDYNDRLKQRLERLVRDGS
jgi:hypothetical protein